MFLFINSVYSSFQLLKFIYILILYISHSVLSWKNMTCFLCYVCANCPFEALCILGKFQTFGRYLFLFHFSLRLISVSDFNLCENYIFLEYSLFIVCRFKIQLYLYLGISIIIWQLNISELLILCLELIISVIFYEFIHSLLL